MSAITLAGTARSLLRDFPKYFETEAGPLNVLTVRLPHPLISPTSVQVFAATAPTPPATAYSTAVTTAWELDDRNGLLKITDEALLGKRILISAYYYTWFSDADLALHVSQSANEVLYNQTGDIDDLEGPYAEVAAMGAVVRALWSLALELSLDIDVSTPEGMYIPARQRFSQVVQMMQYWESEYTQRAESLNIGFGMLEQFNLRRIAKLTNRYVPMYLPREVDDPRWPKRLYPPIPDHTQDPIGGNDPQDVIEVTEAIPPAGINRGYRGYAEIGWTSIGTRGEWP